MKREHLSTGLKPVYDQTSKILILGSFPSVKSRESNFYYGHPQNRFWTVISTLYNVPLLKTQTEKETFLLEHHLALWDVISSLDITGSSDASIKNVRVNKIELILNDADIQHIYTNGKTAYYLFKKYFTYPVTYLPSTSPANASYKLDDLLDAWKVIKL